MEKGRLNRKTGDTSHVGLREPDEPLTEGNGNPQTIRCPYYFSRPHKSKYRNYVTFFGNKNYTVLLMNKGSILLFIKI